MGKQINTIKTKEVVVMMKRDITTHIPLTMPLFEIPVMEAANPNADVEIKKINGDQEYNVPAELARLDEKYGADAETKISHVENVFGRQGRDFHRVVKQLEEDLDIDVVEDSQGGDDYDAKTPAQLRGLLDKAGIEYPSGAQKKRLIDLLRSIEPQRATG